jgi:hypothetical protein
MVSSDMTPKPFHIVLTTVRVPDVLDDYLGNIRRFNHLDEVKIWVIGDRKTPAAAADRARSLTRQGLETVFMDLRDQETWGERSFDFCRRLPVDNETRRNIGYLRALEEGCRVLIAIDDDNFPEDVDFIAGHGDTGGGLSGGALTSSTGFYNVCEHLKLNDGRRVYPRGFPFLLRNGAAPVAVSSVLPAGARSGVTMGLWTGSPDLDAVTWLNGPVTSLAYTGEKRYVLAHGTWMPVSGQNVSVARELIPAYCCVPMGWPVPGGSIQRYGDIWGGYFLQAVLNRTSYHMTFGQPVVNHRRNPHCYLDDLRHEYWGMMLTDWLVDILKSGFRPAASGIPERTRELADFLAERVAARLPEWCPQEMRAFLKQTAENLSAWVSVCVRLM